ncbi:conserved hypothetical protein [Magpiepox virus]|nr:conserved hypothetical protein [Magpiepox virus]
MATNNVFECAKDTLKMVFIIRNDITMKRYHYVLMELLKFTLKQRNIVQII